MKTEIINHHGWTVETEATNEEKALQNAKDIINKEKNIDKKQIRTSIKDVMPEGYEKPEALFRVRVYLKDSKTLMG